MMKKEEDWKVNMTACELRDYSKMISVQSRKQTLEEVKKEFDKIKHTTNKEADILYSDSEGDKKDLEKMAYLYRIFGKRVIKFNNWLEQKLKSVSGEALSIRAQKRGSKKVSK